MKLVIPKDIFDNPHPPQVFLCTTGKKIIGELPVYDCSLDSKWNAYSEFQFSMDRTYTDLLTGEMKVNPLFDKAEGLRKVYVKNIGFFIIQDRDATHGDNDTKTLSCFSTEYETGSKYLEEFYINTGEVASKEVIYLASQYGDNYTIDTPYTADNQRGYDPYESYYFKDYTDADSYTWQQVEIADASVYATYDGSTVAKTLYIKKYPNVRFYWPTKPELSLLHLIFDKIPEWNIGNVESTLWRKERKFEEERIAVYDFLMNEVSDTFKCVVEWNTLTNTVNFYEEAEDGINDDDTVQTRFDTDIFISRDNLAQEISIKYSTDDIKTKLKVSGADDLDIREVNLGKNYIMNLDYYHNLDWMEQDLFEAYDDYLEAVKEYTPQYTEAMQGWVAANNRYSELMNAIPADGNVVLVGDTFEKLYCVYTPINTAYLNYTLSDSNIGSTYNILYSDEKFEKPIDKTKLSDNETFVVQGYDLVFSSSDDNFKCTRNGIEAALKGSDGKNCLLNTLELYSVNEDTEANKTDNILLRLTNSNNDVATIRIYNSSGNKSNPTYLIQKIVVRADSGLTDTPSTYTMLQWITGSLTADVMGLKDFKVQYIGVMGAYFVLAKDETKPENLQDYGVRLLQEKHDVYTTIFQTQIEQMFADEKYQCTASPEPPSGSVAVGTMWLDTDSSPVKLYQYTDTGWVVNDGDLSNCKNYARFKDNYDKLKAVQEVLVEKETKAEYILNGYAINDRKIVLDSTDGSSLEANMHRAALQHFDGYTVTRVSIDATLPLYTFTTSKYPDETFAVYIVGTTPYVSYASSRGVYETKMNRISKLTEFENFFTAEQWMSISPFIREDEFNDSNFLLTGYESEEERLKVCNELVEAASKELKTLSQPSLEFSMDMANILALPEFASLTSQFQLGNFVRVHVRDGYVKRARLLEVHMSFDDLSDFSCTFGNLITTKDEIDKHAELLESAITAGKQVAASAGNWQKAVDKSNQLEKAIAEGLQDCAINIGKASGQAISWDHTGMHFRKYKDGSTTEFEPEELAIINNSLVATNNNWLTSKTAFGKYYINGEERWGPIAEYVTADIIEGKFISGGSIQIGTGDTKFIVHEDGSVEIMSGGQDKYATTSALDVVSKARQYSSQLEYSNSTIFTEPDQECVITCRVFAWEEDITDKLPPGTTFKWIRSSNVDDAEWNATHTYTDINTITITNNDVEKNAQFYCECTFDVEKLS